MFERPRWVLASALVVLLSSSVGADVKPASTPEQALELLVNAARAGDLPGVAARVAPPLSELVVALQHVEKSGVSLRAAMDAKFGTRRSGGPGLAEDWMKSLQDARIVKKTVVRDDKIALSVKLTVKRDGRESVMNAGLTATKHGDDWKLTLDDASIEVLARLQWKLVQQGNVAFQTSFEIRNGTHKSVNDAEEALLMHMEEAAMQVLEAPPGATWSCFESGEVGSRTSTCRRTAEQCKQLRTKATGAPSPCKAQKTAFVIYFEEQSAFVWRALATKSQCYRLLASKGILAKSDCHEVGKVERKPIPSGYLVSKPVYCVPEADADVEDPLCWYGKSECELATSPNKAASCARVDKVYATAWNRMLFLMPTRKRCDAFVSSYEGSDTYPAALATCTEVKSP